MRATTAQNVQFVLKYAAESLAAFGRPRKPLGKPRPVAQKGSVSLVGALRNACNTLGVTDHVRRQVNAAIFTAVELATWDLAWSLWQDGGNSDAGFVAEYDAWEVDTREVVRTLRRAEAYISRITV